MRRLTILRNLDLRIGDRMVRRRNFGLETLRKTDKFIKIALERLVRVQFRGNNC